MKKIIEHGTTTTTRLPNGKAGISCKVKYDDGTEEVRAFASYEDLFKGFKAEPINCPCCGKKMEVGIDDLEGDFYAQCRNMKCDFDGTFGDTVEEIRAKLSK